MEKIKQDIEDLLLIQEQLKSENLEKIDYDKLILQLDKVHALYESKQKIHNEFQTLQQNLIKKITVMENAILVVTKKRPTQKAFESNLQELTALDSQELLQTFEKTETRFHAAFPSTFRSGNFQKNKVRNYKSYK